MGKPTSERALTSALDSAHRLAHGLTERLGRDVDVVDVLEACMAYSVMLAPGSQLFDAAVAWDLEAAGITQKEMPK